MTLRYALSTLATRLACELRASRVFHTPAFPKGSGPPFVNAAVQLETPRSAIEILALLHEIEQGADRERATRWAPRTLDLDLLAHNNEILPSRDLVLEWMGLDLEVQKTTAPDQLILPHPRMHQRSFVLVPLMDIAPDWCHPVLGKTVRELCADLEKADLASVEPL